MERSSLIYAAIAAVLSVGLFFIGIDPNIPDTAANVVVTGFVVVVAIGYASRE
ncbi:MAG: hypothetical protein AAFQ63_24170 [Cyanobacteria bacterium J06621_11]